MERATSDKITSQFIEKAGRLLSEINQQKHIEWSFDNVVLLYKPSACRGIMADEF
jgi:hypothetical protein